MKKAVSLIIAIALLASCAGMGVSPADLKTPHARGRFVLNIYNAAFADHQRFAELENLKPEAKNLLNDKRKILLELGDPLYGPVTIFINNIETGTPLTDAMFNAILDKLIMLETGWYTSTDQAQVFELKPQNVFKKPEDQTDENLQKILARTVVEAQLVPSGPQAQISEVLIGSLIELARLGIHALRAMLTQRGLDEAQMTVKYNEELARFKSLNLGALKELK